MCSLKVAAVSNVTPCRLVTRYRCFGETCCLYIQRSRILLRNAVTSYQTAWHRASMEPSAVTWGTWQEVVLLDCNGPITTCRCNERMFCLLDSGLYSLLLESAREGSTPKFRARLVASVTRWTGFSKPVSRASQKPIVLRLCNPKRNKDNM